MITKTLWKETINGIKKVKYSSAKNYCTIEKNKKEATLGLIVVIIITPIYLIIDLCMLPFELVYLIFYKLLWGVKK